MTKVWKVYCDLRAIDDTAQSLFEKAYHAFIGAAPLRRLGWGKDPMNSSPLQIRIRQSDQLMKGFAKLFIRPDEVSSLITPNGAHCIPSCMEPYQGTKKGFLSEFVHYLNVDRPASQARENGRPSLDSRPAPVAPQNVGARQIHSGCFKRERRGAASLRVA